jgi:hypothetical protein
VVAVDVPEAILIAEERSPGRRSGRASGDGSLPADHPQPLFAVDVAFEVPEQSLSSTLLGAQRPPAGLFQAAASAAAHDLSGACGRDRVSDLRSSEQQIDQACPSTQNFLRSAAGAADLVAGSGIPSGVHSTEANREICRGAQEARQGFRA